MAVTLGTFVATHRTKELVEKVLDSGRISYGSLCGEFESRFAMKHGSLYGIFTNSGTSSLQIALQAMKELYGWSDGDEIIVPALTFVATVNVVYHCNLVPVLVDVDPNYYDLDPKLIEAAITPKTRAIIPVHLFGQPAPMDRIMEIARTHKLMVLEDSCEAMGVCYQEKSVGAWGDAAAFSTYAAHIISTGVGGFSITSEPDLAKRMRSLANHGIDVSELPVGSHYDPTFLGRKFSFTSVGHSFRGTELQAALGMPQLEELHTIVARRQTNAQRLYTRLSGLSEIQLPLVRRGSHHSFMVFPVIIYRENAKAMREHLSYHQIENRSLLPLTTQPCYTFNPNEYPVSNWLQTNGFYVGCHQDLTMADLDRTATIIENYFLGIKESYPV